MPSTKVIAVDLDLAPAVTKVTQALGVAEEIATDVLVTIGNARARGERLLGVWAQANRDTKVENT